MIQKQENYNNMKRLDVWSLIANEDFKEACNEADLEFKETKSIFPLRNKVYALFHLSMYSEALELLEKIIQLEKGESDSDYIFTGIAYWLLDRKKDAVNIWQEGEKCIYTDAAGGVELQLFLYFASTFLSDDVLKNAVKKSLKKLVKLKSATNFPAPLGSYILEELSETELLSYVTNVPILRERQLCQADFTIAIKKLEFGNQEEYMKKLNDCVSYGSSSYLSKMYYLAKGILLQSALTQSQG